MHLMHREILEPHLPKDTFLNEIFLPVTNALKTALQALCPYLDERNALPIVHSIIGQLVHIVQMVVMISGTTNVTEDPMNTIDQYVKHIVHFTATAIRSYEKALELYEKALLREDSDTIFALVQGCSKKLFQLRFWKEQVGSK